MGFRRGVILPCLALAAIGCASFRARDTADQIRVLVYNIHAGKDATGADNLARVAEIIRSTGADVVLLQEVDRGTVRSGKVDQLRVLERLTGFQGAFGKTLDYQGGDYGIATLSRWAITSDTLFRLPVDPPQQRGGGSREPRGALHALVARPGTPIAVFNTHIDASREDTYRRQELAALLRLAARSITELRRPTLVGGDLNAEPGSAVIEMLRGSSVRDPWSECGVGSGLSYPANQPVKRIDYLLLSADWKCHTAAVIQSETSDHRPVLFVIETAR